MTDEASFLAAIAENPKDDTLPLVFADWLDDHGDPRGQWIRHYAVRPWMHPNYQPVPAILESLKKDKKVIEARRAAEVIGEPIVPGLVELLKHEKARVRLQACMCLRKIGKRAKAAAPELLKLLADKDYSVRGAAAKALQDIGTGEVSDTGQLKAALTDENWRVRAAATKVLGKMRAKGDVLGELVERLESPLANDRAEAIEALAQLGTKEALEPLDRALDDPEAAVRVVAVQALGRLRVPGVAESLCRAMADRDANVRKAAVEQFSSYRSDVLFTPEVVAAMAKLLSDQSPEVRETAACRLGCAGELAAPAIPRLIEALDDAERVQIVATGALAAVGRGNKAVLDALIDKTTTGGWEARAAVVRALGTAGRDDPAALAAIMRRLKDRSDDVIAAAVEQLQQWTKLPASAVAPLLDRFRRLRESGSGQYSSYTALTALARIRPTTPEVIATLREAVRAPIGYELGAALEALAVLGPAAEPAIPELVALFNPTGEHHQYYNYHSAAKALAAIGEPGLRRLAELIEGDNEQAHWYIFQGFSQLGDAAAPLLPAILRRLEKTTDDNQRGRLIDAIASLGPAAAAAIPALLDAAANGGEVYTRANAVNALARLGDALLPHLGRVAELAKGPDGTSYRANFAQLFAQFAPKVPEVKKPLRELLRKAKPVKSEDWNEHWSRKHVRQTCAAALLSFKDAALLPDLAPLLTDPEADIRRDFVYQLDRLDAPGVLPLIREALTDEDESVRLRAVEVLGRREDAAPEAIEGLVRLVDDRVPKVRRAAIDLLGKLRAGGDEVLAALTAASGDADARTADRARIALKKVTPKEPKPAKAPNAKGKKRK